ncbi:hypothetical protein [Rhizobium sp. YTU87027]|uniref:hypothetical protein n=1 Tax=Rhizobium sp. YTU87027 TaxID=3417741 RepID=UPI003D69C3C2
MLFAGLVSRAFAAGPVEPAYIKSLAAPGKMVLVVEYYDGSSAIVSRKGYASAIGFRARSSNEIVIDDKITLHLFGVEPCEGQMVNRKEGFSGSCEDFAEQQLKILLKYPKVILCRAFVSEENAPKQDVTCFGHYFFPGSLDSISNFEEDLVALGALRLAKKADGSLMRPDLAEAERIGRQGFGMWADPRTKR